MGLLTEEQRALLLRNGTPEAREGDHPPVAKVFLPGSGATWLIVDAEPVEEGHPEGDLILFGLCDLGQGCPELGNVLLSDLEELRHPTYGIPVERDLYFKATGPISTYAAAAREAGRIVDDVTMSQDTPDTLTPSDK